MQVSDCLFGSCACGGRIVDAEGETVCSSCGVVVGYGAEEQSTPVAGSPTGLLGYDGCPATTMGCQRVDYAGRLLARPDIAKRMVRHNMWTQKYNRTMPVAMAQLGKLRDDLRMTDAAHEYAAYLFRKAVTASFLVGRRVTHCTAAAALLACRKHGINRTVRDIMRVTGLARRDIYRTYRKLRDKLAPDLMVPAPDPVSFIARIGAEVGVSEAARRGAQAILASMDRTEIAGKDPMGLAAGVLYLACVNRGEAVLRRDIAEAAGVAETTLATRFNDMAGKAAGGAAA